MFYCDKHDHYTEGGCDMCAVEDFQLSLFEDSMLNLQMTFNFANKKGE